LKIRTEICDDGQEEIIIRCRARTDQIKNIESMLESLVAADREMILHSSGVEYYVPLREILFFEAYDGKIFAHTKDKILNCEYKLFELEDLLPSSFARISKSTVANIMQISHLRRELVGNGEIGFKGCDKRTYFSRSYYKILKDKIDEMRLGK
jgi:DNA-binding LytR/AlgR family response regulator